MNVIGVRELQGETVYHNARGLLYERYGIPFTPPTLTEYRFCTVITAPEQLVEDLGHGTRRPE